MKLIIDIDEDVRIAISRMGLLRIPDEMQKKVDKAIQSGTPLDNLRTEIDNIKVYGQIDEHNLFVRSADGIKKMALIVIDRYRNEVNE
jgi:hypothetical protein